MTFAYLGKFHILSESFQGGRCSCHTLIVQPGDSGGRVPKDKLGILHHGGDKPPHGVPRAADKL